MEKIIFIQALCLNFDRKLERVNHVKLSRTDKFFIDLFFIEILTKVTRKCIILIVTKYNHCISCFAHYIANY